MRYLTISVWLLRDANIKALHPSLKEKSNMELFMSLLMSQQKNILSNLTQ